jgi:hypothetical protein
VSAALAALGALALAALPEGTARYRAVLGDVTVGVAELGISCAAARCRVRSGSTLRLPAESGGELVEEAVEVEVDRDGRYRGGPIALRRRGASSAPAGVDGAVPAAVAEVVLAHEAARGAGRICVPFFVEGRATPGQACARREGDAVAGEVGGVPVRIEPVAGGFPREIVVEGRFRYVRDAAAAVPREAPPLAGTRVPGPPDPGAARSFCGVPRDPPADAALAAALPAPASSGDSCRERTERWLAAARLLGHEGRTAVGVAWDGRAFVWHAWAEVRSGGAWIPVDPSFGERPARGPRFTLARYGAGDAAARDAAGARIIACWGVAVVE